MSSSSSTFNRLQQLLTTYPTVVDHVIQSSLSSSSSVIQSSTIQSSLPSLQLPQSWENEIYKLHYLLLFYTILYWFGCCYCMMIVRTTRKIRTKHHHQPISVLSSITKSTSSSKTSSSTTSSTTLKNQSQKKMLLHRSNMLYTIISTISILITSIILYVVSMILLITFVSPYNTYLAKHVFTIPLLTPEECQYIIDISHIVAKKNVKYYTKLVEANDNDNDEDDDDDDDASNSILDDAEYKLLYQKPYGWNKVRHEHYATTDLNVLEYDPFTKRDRNWIYHTIFQQRIRPILSRIYGIPIKSIIADDIFIVRYDYSNSTNIRNQLRKHHDGGDLSFTITLNNNFTGGGTQFYNMYTNTPFALIQSIQEQQQMNNNSMNNNSNSDRNSNVGQLSFFHPLIKHEGYPITSGQRFIMVGFLRIVPTLDTNDITTTTTTTTDDVSTTTSNKLTGTKVSTGLSIYASYLNWSWLFVRIKESYIHDIEEVVLVDDDEKTMVEENNNFSKRIWYWLCSTKLYWNVLSILYNYHERISIHTVTQFPSSLQQLLLPNTTTITTSTTTTTTVSSLYNNNNNNSSTSTSCNVDMSGSCN